MSFTLGLAQCAHPVDGNVLALVRTYAERAAHAGVNLLVFPECLMTPFEKTREDFLASAQPADGAFSGAVADISAHFGLWTIFTMNERNPYDEHANPCNTAIVVDSTGARHGIYRKTHLFDTDTIQESERMAYGKTLFEPIDTPFAKLGLGICYDLRFPEVARAAALAGCEVMVYPAAWVDGPHKITQWETLLAARAIENEMFVAGLSRTGGRYAGHSRIVDPRGVVLANAQHEEALVVAEINLNVMRETRASMPVLKHRRPDLYQQR